MGWRPRPELNWCTRFCRPLRNHSATWPHGGELIYALPGIGNQGALIPCLTRFLYANRCQLRSKNALVRRVCGGGNPALVSALAQARAARFGPRGIAPASARNWRAASARYPAASRGCQATSPPPRWWTGRRGAARGEASHNATDAPGRG